MGRRVGLLPLRRAAVAEETVEPRREFALLLIDDEPADEERVAQLLLDASATFRNQFGDLLGYRHGDTDRSDAPHIEGVPERARVRLPAIRVIVLRHSPGRAPSSRLPVGSGA